MHSHQMAAHTPTPEGVALMLTSLLMQLIRFQRFLNQVKAVGGYSAWIRWQIEKQQYKWYDSPV